MNKTKQSLKSITKYLHELSVVVIGIAITLGVSNWLTARNEKKDMERYLGMVKFELETLMGDVDWLTDLAEKGNAYSGYLLSHDKAALHPDSLQRYADIWYRISSFLHVSNAFDMFKASGSMRLVKDNNLLLHIWDTYSWLGFLKEYTDTFYNREKMEANKKEKQFINDGKKTAAPMYDFYTFDEGDCSSTWLQNCKETKKKLEETIVKIENELQK